MKLSRIIALAAAALLIPLLAACGGSASGSSESSATPDATIGAQPAGGDPLAGTSWVLTGGLSKDVSASGITIEFADKDVSGKSGVNTYFGGYTSATDGTLQSAFGYTLADGTLTVFGAADQVLTYSQK